MTLEGNEVLYRLVAKANGNYIDEITLYSIRQQNSMMHGPFQRFIRIFRKYSWILWILGRFITSTIYCCCKHWSIYCLNSIDNSSGGSRNFDRGVPNHPNHKVGGGQNLCFSKQTFFFFTFSVHISSASSMKVIKKKKRDTKKKGKNKI